MFEERGGGEGEEDGDVPGIFLVDGEGETAKEDGEKNKSDEADFGEGEEGGVVDGQVGAHILSAERGDVESEADPFKWVLANKLQCSGNFALAGGERLLFEPAGGGEAGGKEGFEGEKSDRADGAADSEGPQ